KALWAELSDQPPPRADGAEMLKLMLSRLPDVSYERINSPFLRRAQMSWPKTRAR
ncbi:MAG: hypothetical protein JWQ97_2267, partial [Phenylobacterium sp.]|nr:hypothetical protein [Phenylobacterium sp.]